jgi:hypothetical protein
MTLLAAGPAASTPDIASGPAVQLEVDSLAYPQVIGIERNVRSIRERMSSMVPGSRRWPVVIAVAASPTATETLLRLSAQGSRSHRVVGHPLCRPSWWSRGTRSNSVTSPSGQRTYGHVDLPLGNAWPLPPAAPRRDVTAPESYRCDQREPTHERWSAPLLHDGPLLDTYG